MSPLGLNVFLMPLTSYAQNFEDVILWRALKHVERGFYIDVGAQDPLICSVSMAFYEHGWRGVHVEPSPEYAAKLRQARPGEDVLDIAVGKEDGEIEFFEIAGTGLSTGDREIAQRHASQGFAVTRTSVTCRSFAAVLDAYGDRDIHWLKIDVEGMEEAVINGWSSSAIRPWIVLVESTAPLSTELKHHSWDEKLRNLGYEFVYFDGLNQFYVSTIHPELAACFESAPNLFDEFQLTEASPFCEVIAGQAKQRLEAVRNERTTLVGLLAAERSERAALAQNLITEQATRSRE